MADTVSILKIWPMAIFFQRFSCCAKAAEDLRDADMVWFFLSFQEGRNMQFPGPFSPSRGSHPLHTSTWLLLTLKHTRRDDQGVRNALDISALPSTLSSLFSETWWVLCYLGTLEGEVWKADNWVQQDLASEHHCPGPPSFLCKNKGERNLGGGFRNIETFWK